MEDLSLHILDLAENSLRAEAKNVRIIIHERNHELILQIKDDGKGMDDETLIKAKDPFFTTKNGKKFGLGISLLAQAVEETGGTLKIEKNLDAGINITAIFNKKNIDMKPIGNINSTMRVLKASHPDVNFLFEHIIEHGDRM